MVDRTEWEEQGPYCDICGAHMGDLYNEKTGKIKNPHGYTDYGNNTCPRCGQEYSYEKSDAIVLSKEQLAILRKHAGLQTGKTRRAKEEEIQNGK